MVFSSFRYCSIALPMLLKTLTRLPLRVLPAVTVALSLWGKGSEVANNTGKQRVCQDAA